MHAILARETSNSAFSPKTADDGDATVWAKKTEQRLQKAVEAIAGVQTWQREQDQERAQEAGRGRLPRPAAQKRHACEHH